MRSLRKSSLRPDRNLNVTRVGHWSNSLFAMHDQLFTLRNSRCATIVLSTYVALRRAVRAFARALGGRKRSINQTPMMRSCSSRLGAKHCLSALWAADIPPEMPHSAETFEPVTLGTSAAATAAETCLCIAALAGVITVQRSMPIGCRMKRQCARFAREWCARVAA